MEIRCVQIDPPLFKAYIPGCTRKKIGNLGIPFFVTPWCFSVTIVPTLGGFRLCSSSNPEPILNMWPALSLTWRAPNIDAQRPVPGMKKT